MKLLVPALAGLAFLSQLSCGLILQGRYQDVSVLSVPPSAHASSGTEVALTPGEISVRRRSSTSSFVRIRKDGFYSECRLLRWERNRGLIAIDSIPLAIPLLVDLAFGTLPGRYGDVSVTLEPIPPGYADVLPSDELIRDALNRGLNVCEPPPETIEWIRLRSGYGEEAKKVVAVSGDVSRPYELLGQVDARAKGTNWWAFNFWHVSGFGSFNFRRYRYKESHAGLNELLKLKALQRFGSGVDALINVQYEDLPDYDVSATGIAVRFVEDRESRPVGSASARLSEVDRLFKHGAITHDEYERKRHEILNGL